jgi:hypothetical protein
MSSGAGSGRGHGPMEGRWYFQLAHHLLAAALMASAMLSLERRGWLEWLDAVMLSVVATEAPTQAQAPDSLPRVVLIDDVTYADTFALQSPLDRAALGRVLQDALSARPRTLLVDLQVEPSASEDMPRPLDTLLADAARGSAGHAGTHVVLPLPARRTPALDQRSLQWMRQMCEAGVQFGSADVRSHFGTVVRLDQDQLSIAQVAQTAPVASADEAAPSLCALARQGAALEVIWALLKDTQHHGKTTPLSPAVVKQLQRDALSWRPDTTAARLQAQPGGTIVVGGSYDPQDRFVTSAMPDPVPGALVHASAVAPAKLGSSHAGAWVLDVFLGTALGVLFAAAWRCVGRHSLETDQWRWRDVVKAWQGPARAVALWLVAAVLAYGLMKASGGLMAHGLWLNPGPIVLGMLLHTLLLKEEAEHPPINSGRALWRALTLRDDAGHAIAHWRAYTQYHPAWPLQLFFIFIGLLYGLSGSH